MAIADSLYMKLGSEIFNSLKIKTQLLKRPQCVIVGVGATHFQKDGVEGNRGSLTDGAEILVLFLLDAQLALRSSVLPVPNLDSVKTLGLIPNSKKQKHSTACLWPT